jgi:carbamoyl-phosphate synthase large subunit
MNILVTSVGSNPSIGIIKALRLSENSLHICITGIDTNLPHLCAGALLVDEFIQVPAVYEREKYVETILEIIKEKKIDCVFPVHDHELVVIASLRKDFPELCFWAVNEESVIETCNNKILANGLAAKLGILTPESFIDYKNIPPEKFPVIAKPVNGVSSRGMCIANDKEQLEIFMNDKDEKKYLIQSYISNDAEFTIDAYSTYDGKFYGAMTRQRIETKDGIATKGVTIQNDYLIDMTKRFLNEIKYCGIANLQFIQSKGKYYFIEINPRFSGAGILSIHAGFNSPMFTIKESLNEKLQPLSSLNLKYDFYMTRYWQENFSYAAGNII